ncbi:MAG: hypothetical protein ACLUCU_09000 [Slackia sp.]
MTGTGVENVETLGATFDGVVVGYVETCEEHPDSDHMHVVTVDVGVSPSMVCGAPNIAQGIKLPWPRRARCFRAISRLKIQAARVGTAACAAHARVGHGQRAQGIWVLPADARRHADADYLDLTDTVSIWKSRRTAPIAFPWSVSRASGRDVRPRLVRAAAELEQAGAPFDAVSVKSPTRALPRYAPA